MTEKKKSEVAMQNRKWMSVRDMGDILGLGKTERYWLIHRNYFQTNMLFGKMWVNVASFEKWYANQVWYHKTNGEEPGRELKVTSYSPKDIQDMLGIDNTTVYEILKKEKIETVTVNSRKRVPAEAFWNWYNGQARYRTQEDRKEDAAAEAASISLPEMARLLGVSRNTVYGILNSKKYTSLLDIIKIADQKRVTRESFERFLKEQNDYDLLTFEYENLDAEKKRAYENYKRIHSTKSKHSQKEMKSDYLTIAEAATMAGVSASTVTTWHTTGKIPVRKAGSVIRIPRKEFEQWLQHRNGGE